MNIYNVLVFDIICWKSYFTNVTNAIFCYPFRLFHFKKSNTTDLTWTSFSFFHNLPKIVFNLSRHNILENVKFVLIKSVSQFSRPVAMLLLTYLSITTINIGIWNSAQMVPISSRILPGRAYIVVFVGGVYVWRYRDYSTLYIGREQWTDSILWTRSWYFTANAGFNQA